MQERHSEIKGPATEETLQSIDRTLKHDTLKSRKITGGPGMEDKRENAAMEIEDKKESPGSPDYGALIIEMVREIGGSDEKFLRQIYTIMRRHVKKEG